MKTSGGKWITVRQALFAILALFFLGEAASLFPSLTIITVLSVYAVYVLIPAVVIRLVVKWVRADPRVKSRT